MLYRCFTGIFQKKALPKSAILDFAAIWEFFKNCSSMEF
jgi:hypothetical protein